MAQKKITLGRAISSLAEQYNIENNPPVTHADPTQQILKKSTSINKKNARDWLENIRGFGEYSKTALQSIIDSKCFRQGRYNNQDVLIVPLFQPSPKIAGEGELLPKDIYSMQYISLEGKALVGESNKIFPKGCKGKGVFPLIESNHKEIFVVESISNALALFVIGYSAICVFSTSNLNLMPKIKKAFPNNDLILWLDKGIEKIAIECIRENVISGVWWDEKVKTGYDINDLLRDSGKNFPAKADAITAKPTCTPSWWKTDKEEVDDKRPEIYIEGGGLSKMIDKAEDAIIESSIYQRAGQLVHIVNDGQGLKPIAAAHLIEKFTREITWKKWNRVSMKYKNANCPKQVAESYMARPSWRVRKLNGIIMAPTLRRDGSTLSAPGFDKKTGLYFYADKNKKPWEIPKKPSKAQAEDAFFTFHNVYKDFPFQETTDLAVFIAAILTVLVRNCVATAPLFVVSAPKMASGKTLLAGIASRIVHNVEMLFVSQTRDSDEEKKRLLGILLAATRVVCFDNCSFPLESAALCSILTQQTWGERILGANFTPQVSTNSTTWFATGNNMQIKGDMSSRALVCQLNPKCERPEERQFGIDLFKYIPEHRRELVIAGLTILKAYHLADRPSTLKPFGRFEEWSSLIRGALVWIKVGDPCDTRKSIEENDPKREDLVRLLSAWQLCFGDQKMSVKEAVNCSVYSGGNYDVLRTALENIDSKVSPRKIGTFLGKNKDRIEDGKFFEGAGKGRYGKNWKVTQVTQTKQE